MEINTDLVGKNYRFRQTYLEGKIKFQQIIQYNIRKKYCEKIN